MTLHSGGLVPPATPAYAIPRAAWQLSRDRLGLMSAAARRGDAVRIAAGVKTLYFFNHPDHAKHILVDNHANYHKGLGLRQARRALGEGLLTSEGEQWRRQRTAVQPAFQHQRIAARTDGIVAAGMAFVDRLRARADTRPVDILDELTGLTLDVLGRSLLDADLSADDRIGEAFAAVQDQAMFEMASLGLVPSWLPLPRQARFRRARRDLGRLVDGLVDGHAGAGSDALSRLVAADREAPAVAGGRGRLRDQLITLLLAGHETTASTLTWAFYLLDRHPAVLSRLRAEVSEVLGDRRPEFADVARLRYTTMVISEAIRLYPPVWMLSRISLEPDVVGGFQVPAGADVLVCPYTLHRHPDYWPQPERFCPERFARGSTGARPRYAYLPFGAGPRVCVGSQLGMLEAVLVTALVVRDLRLRTVSGRAVTPEPMLSLRARGGLPMTVHAT